MSKLEEKQKMMNENLVYWINQQRAAILEVDPTTRWRRSTALIRVNIIDYCERWKDGHSA